MPDVASASGPVATLRHRLLGQVRDVLEDPAVSLDDLARRFVVVVAREQRAFDSESAGNPASR
jgi:hypothetical protein